MTEKTRDPQVATPPKVERRPGLLGTLDRHQIDGPAYIIGAILSAYAAFPNSIAKKFLFFQHYDSLTDTYEKSWDDMYFLFFWIAMFTFLRAVVMQYVLMPMAQRLGAKGDRNILRFGEQGWICLYYSCSWIWGMYCMQQTTSWNNYLVWFNHDHFFDNYPLTALSLSTKTYYWLQFSFWLQQMFVLAIEAPRKDFLAMMSHHIVTALLIIASLVLNVTTFGIATLISMDLADIVLAFGKCLKYIELPDKICDPTFAVFGLVWIWTRHFMYGHIIYAWIKFGGDYNSKTTHVVITLLLLILQSLMFFWLWGILRIVYKMFTTNSGVVDDRSDDEEERVPAITEKKSGSSRKSSKQ